MAPTYYEDIPGWAEIVERIKARDGYTCQGCKIEEGTITFPKQSIYPRYERAFRRNAYKARRFLTEA